MKLKNLLLIAAVGLAATSAMAQGFRGGMRGGMMYSNGALVNRPDVIADLSLTDDQKNKLAEVRENMRSEFRAAMQAQGDDRMKTFEALGKKSNDEVAKILTPDQMKRLKEIRLQLGSYGLLSSDKEVQNELALTEDEKSKIATLQSQADDANKSIMDKIQNQEIDRDQGRESMTKNGTALNTAIEGLLTADQKAKFKAMQGKTFTATSQPGFGPRGGGGGR